MKWKLPQSPSRKNWVVLLCDMNGAEKKEMLVHVTVKEIIRLKQCSKCKLTKF